MAKPRKAKLETEYRLTILPKYVEREQRHAIVFLLETTKIFTSFRYDIVVEERLDKNMIAFKILGLKAPKLSLPSVGGARFSREFEGLKGTYTVQIEGLDGVIHSCSVRIGTKRLELLEPPASTYVEVAVDNSPWFNG